jgi:hypothetical protein
MIPLPPAGSDMNIASGAKPPWGYTDEGEPWVAYCGAKGRPVEHVGDAPLAATIVNIVLALHALSFVLLFVSPMVSFESNRFSRAFE